MGQALRVRSCVMLPTEGMLPNLLMRKQTRRSRGLNPGHLSWLTAAQTQTPYDFHHTANIPPSFLAPLAPCLG